MSRLEEFAKGQEVKVFPSGREAEIAEQKTGKREPKYKRFLRKVAMMTTGLALINATLIGTPAFAQEQKDDNNSKPKTEQVVSPVVVAQDRKTANYNETTKQADNIPRDGTELRKYIFKSIGLNNPIFDFTNNKGDDIAQIGNAVALQSAVFNLTYSETGALLIRNALIHGYKFALLHENLEGDKDGEFNLDNKTISIKSLDAWYKEYSRQKSLKSAIEYDYVNDVNLKKYDKTIVERNLTSMMIWDLTHELRHVWQQTNGLYNGAFNYTNSNAPAADKKMGETSPRLVPEDMFVVYRAMEADAEAFAALSCYEMSQSQKAAKENKTFSNKAPFKIRTKWQEKQAVPLAFLGNIDKGTEAALSAAFVAWNKIYYAGETLREGSDTEFSRFFLEKNTSKEKLKETDLKYSWTFSEKLDVDSLVKKLSYPESEKAYLDKKDVTIYPINPNTWREVEKFLKRKEVYDQQIPKTEEKGAFKTNSSQGQKFALKSYDNQVLTALKVRRVYR